MEWIKRIFRRGKNNSRPTVGQDAAVDQYAYSSDRPICSKSEDRFNRWAFAKRIADTLASRQDTASIVIGLYGPWGDGKTSALRLMEIALQYRIGVRAQFSLI